MKTYREIKIGHGQRKELMKLFDTSYPSLRAALRFETGSEKAVQIRAYALSHGGVLLESEVVPECSGEGDAPGNVIAQNIISNNKE